MWAPKPGQAHGQPRCRPGADGTDAAGAGHQRGRLVRRPSPGTRPGRRRPASRRPGRRPARRSAAAPRDRQRAAHAPCGPLSSSSRSWARASSASPARMAGPTPNTVQAVGRCRRSVSPSMMSSCSSEKLCTSSTATAAGTPFSDGTPAARADSRASAGRRALRRAVVARVALRVGPAEVVGAHPAHFRGAGPRPRPWPGRRCPGRGPTPAGITAAQCPSLGCPRGAPASHRRRSGRRALRAVQGAESPSEFDRRVQSAAHRALHRVWPSGIGPCPGERQAR